MNKKLIGNMINMTNKFYLKHYKVDDRIFDVYHSIFFSNPSKKILDVGCSIGNFLVHCGEGSEGIDNDKEQLKIARSRGLEVKKCDLNSERFPYKDNTFDAVNSTSTFEHLKDPRNCISEIRRVLKKEGKFVIRIPNIFYWKFRFWDSYDHYTPFTKNKVNIMCINAGFDNFKLHYNKQGLFGLRMLYNLGIKPSILKKLMFFCSFFKREQILIEGYK